MVSCSTTTRPSMPGWNGDGCIKIVAPQARMDIHVRYGESRFHVNDS